MSSNSGRDASVPLHASPKVKISPIKLDYRSFVKSPISASSPVIDSNRVITPIELSSDEINEPEKPSDIDLDSDECKTEDSMKKFERLLKNKPKAHSSMNPFVRSFDSNISVLTMSGINMEIDVLMKSPPIFGSLKSYQENLVELEALKDELAFLERMFAMVSETSEAKDKADIQKQIDQLKNDVKYKGASIQRFIIDVDSPIHSNNKCSGNVTGNAKQPKLHSAPVWVSKKSYDDKVDELEKLKDELGLFKRLFVLESLIPNDKTKVQKRIDQLENDIRSKQHYIHRCITYPPDDTEELEKQLGKKDEEIASKNLEIEENKKALDQKDREIEEKNREIEEKDHEIAELKSLLDQIRNISKYSKS